MIEIILQISSVYLTVFVSLIFSWIFLITKRFLKEKNIGKLDHYPKVSVLIPAYNEEKNIEECIKSVLNTKYPKLEVIVVDDGSKDKTFEIAKKYTKKVFKINHSGKANALNFGISKAKGEFIFVLDADTIVEKNIFEKLLPYFKNKNVAAVTPMIRIKKQKKFSILENFQVIEYSYQNVVGFGLSTLKRGTLNLYGAATIYRASILKKIKFDGSNLVEDFDMAANIQSKGYKIVVGRVFAYTKVPIKLKNFISQRIRWAVGGLKTVIKFRKSFFNLKKGSFGLYSLPIFSFWYVFVPISFFCIIYQIIYWIPQNSFEIPFYFFKWFSIFGPINSLIMLPVWGVKYYIIVGSLSGLLTFSIALFSLKVNNELNFKNIIFSFFLFPYYFFIGNSVILLSIVLTFLKIKLKWYK
ncbi:MAG: glycosyltransferase [Candidatus Aenigmatarchaeota archaeon]